MIQKDEISNFSLQIEELARDKSLSYMEAVITYCEEREFEIEIAAKLISPTLKSKIKQEAEGLNYLPKSNTAKLPL